VFQRLLSVALVAVSVVWIVFSHVPSARALLPTIAYPGDGRWMAVAALLSLGVFLALQFWLLRTTVAGVRRHQQRISGNVQPLHLHLGLEALWTALPVVITLGLAWAAYGLWANLAAP
jgi:heme/copper-type cytochrome/quinol oxidase subunit 2